MALFLYFGAWVIDGQFILTNIMFKTDNLRNNFMKAHSKTTEFELVNF